MASNVAEKYMIVAAIDFGTTFSGYAFSMETDPTHIFMNKDWGMANLKTPTSILTDSAGNFKAFGYEAEKEFAGSAADDCGVHLFQHFKMELHRLEELSKRIVVKSKDGKSTTTAFDLVVMALKYMKTCFLQDLRKTGTEVIEKDVRWVVTVPAIWSDVSKRFMREAAFKAELIPDMQSTQLLIALEPEAAAIFCRSLDAENMASETSDTSMTLPTGTKYIVVDAGGGTVDIAVHQVTGPKTAKELYYPSGGDWGGNKVNQGFEDLMAKVLGHEVIATYKSKCGLAWWEFIQQFEARKKNWVDGRPLQISLSNVLAVTYKELKREPIEEAFHRSKSLGIAFRQGIIQCRSPPIKKVFDEAVDLTINHLEDLLEDPRMERVENMMLVGGFAESPYFQKAIKSKFGSTMNILIPQQASLCVVKGAVLFGHRPATIQSRCAARTYGTGTNTQFDESIHPESKRVEIEGIDFCTDIFSTFVEKGTMVDLDEVRNFTFYPLTSTSTAAGFTLYSADQEEVEYIDEYGVTEIDEMTLPMPDTSLETDRPIDVEVKFGGTEISVKATDVSTSRGLSVQRNMCFDTSY